MDIVVLTLIMLYIYPAIRQQSVVAFWFICLGFLEAVKPQIKYDIWNNMKLCVTNQAIKASLVFTLYDPNNWKQYHNKTWTITSSSFVVVSFFYEDLRKKINDWILFHVVISQCDTKCNFDIKR